MQFASFEIQIGASGIQQIAETQVAFHHSVATLLLGQEAVRRIGGTYCIPVSHHEAVHDTRLLPQRFVQDLTFSIKKCEAPNSIDLIIFDFSGTPFFSVRDPLLLALSTGIADVCLTKLCCNFAFLLSVFPGKNGAFRRKLAHFDEIVDGSPYRVRLVSATGDSITYSHEEIKAETLGNHYTNALATVYGGPQQRLEKKCVRRLGHFASTPIAGVHRCRHFSYYLHDCGNELTHAVDEWWSAAKCEPTAILYDLRTSELLREVVVAHANRLDIRAERIVDVCESEELALAIKPQGPIVLVLDVVDTGATLLRYYNQLRERGFEIQSCVLAGISKRGTKDSHFDDPSLNIHGLIARESETVERSCIQCRLQLPFTSDVAEELAHLRSYDMLFMISKSGWAHEPVQEVPTNIGKAFDVLPDFSAMLHHFGGWLAYKLYNGLRDRGVPDDWFIIHPEEGDSSLLSDKLYECAHEELTIVRIPRDVITEAQQHGNNWTNILVRSETEYWWEQLSSMRGGGALVLDILNGSDSTGLSLLNLLSHFDVKPFSYACLVDFNPKRHTRGIGSVSKFALYEWSRPRILNVANVKTSN